MNKEENRTQSKRDKEIKVKEENQIDGEESEGGR